MFMVGSESLKNAEKNGHARAYLARLSPGLRDSVDRQFAPKAPHTKKGGNRRAFALSAKPGDVFETRRWWWNGEKYDGGMVWFGIDEHGGIVMLTWDEAFASVRLPRIDGPAPDTTVPAVPVATRMIAKNIACWAADSNCQT